MGNCIAQAWVWFSTRPYVELGDLQSLTSILIAVNLAPPFFAGVLESQMRTLQRIYEEVRTRQEAIWMFGKESLPNIRKLIGTDQLVGADLLVDSLKRNEESSSILRKHMDRAAAAVKIYEDHVRLQYGVLLIYAAVQFSFLVVFSLIPEMQITGFILLGIGTMLLGTSYTAFASIWEYFKIVRYLKSGEEMFKTIKQMANSMVRLAGEAMKEVIATQEIQRRAQQEGDRR